MGSPQQVHSPVTLAGRPPHTDAAQPAWQKVTTPGGIDYSTKGQPLGGVGTWLVVQPAQLVRGPGETQRLTAWAEVGDAGAPDHAQVHRSCVGQRSALPSL